MPPLGLFTWLPIVTMVTLMGSREVVPDSRLSDRNRRYIGQISNRMKDCQEICEQVTMRRRLLALEAEAIWMVASVGYYSDCEYDHLQLQRLATEAVPD